MIPKLNKGKILKLLALLIDVGIPIAVTMSQFPVWVDKSASATVSGLFITLAMLCCVPFYRRIKEWLKAPSAPVMWAIIFALSVAMKSIIAEIVVVCMWGMIANIIGALIHKVGESLDKE